MPGDTYSVDGNVEWKVENTLVGIIQNNMDVSAIFGDAVGDINVRVAHDSTDARAMPGIAVEATVVQTLRGTTEHRCFVRMFCETDSGTDTTGEQVKALMGALRDIIQGDNKDDFFNEFNDTERGIKLNSVGSIGETTAENDTNFEHDLSMRRMILGLDLWVYIGS